MTRDTFPTFGVCVAVAVLAYFVLVLIGVG